MNAETFTSAEDAAKFIDRYSVEVVSVTVFGTVLLVVYK